MAYSEEEINQALLMLAGNIASGNSFNDAMARGSKKIEELRTSKTKSIKDSLDIEKSIYEVAKLKKEVEGEGQIIEQAYLPHQIEIDKTVHQAYGALDSLIFGVGSIGETFGMNPTATRESRDAARTLNKDIKIVLSGSFKGRPSNYLLREIEELLPSIGNWGGGDAVAHSRYIALKNRFDSWLPELDAEIINATGKTKVDLQKQRAKAGHISKRLQVGVDGFSEGGTKPNINAVTDYPVGFQFPDTDEGLDELENQWRAITPGEPYKK